MVVCSYGAFCAACVYLGILGIDLVVGLSILNTDTLHLLLDNVSKLLITFDTFWLRQAVRACFVSHCTQQFLCNDVHRLLRASWFMWKGWFDCMPSCCMIAAEAVGNLHWFWWPWLDAKVAYCSNVHSAWWWGNSYWPACKGPLFHAATQTSILPSCLAAIRCDCPLARTA